MSKYQTPGPWEVFQNDGNVMVVGQIKPNGKRTKVAVFPAMEELDVKLANANLIAAAHDLLKEMERMLVVIQRIEDELPATWAEVTQGTGIATANAYRLAISRAKGETK